MVAQIILNYNSYQDTTALVESLLSHKNAEDYRIIVVDNNSNDRDRLEEYCLSKSACIVEDQRVCLDSSSISGNIFFFGLKENRGYSIGNNVGLQFAFSMGIKYAFVINPDVVIVDSDVFAKGIRIFNDNSNIGVLGFKVVLPNDQRQGPFRSRLSWDLFFYNVCFPISGFLKERQLKSSLLRNEVTFVPAVVGCFVGFDLNKLHEIDYYDSNIFLYFEEYIISERMRRFGFRTAYTEQCTVLHNHDYDNELVNLYKKNAGKESRSYYERNYLGLSLFASKLIHLSELYYANIRALLKRLAIF